MRVSDAEATHTLPPAAGGGGGAAAQPQPGGGVAAAAVVSRKWPVQEAAKWAGEAAEVASAMLISQGIDVGKVEITVGVR